ncbi:hypothetical protein BA192_07945 [Yersinia pseudotuberculosis]|uniref:hypothetical protein n=1 Tax=Yersinia pseudotuberculosis TaxID=633 RepID=UPI000D0ABAB3|nr:hypothetical protein [Yersinia pseudotuberculosis]PSH38363.1 hypothetical protein BA192_07945 [Yersinia pseudotuberculosis]
MANQIDQRHIELMQHTIGVNEQNREPYRNHYIAGDGHYANADLEVLVAASYMTSQPAPTMWGDGTVYCCTRKGSALAISNLPAPKKRSRYEDYLDSDTCQSFAESLGIDVPDIEYGHWHPNQGKFRMVSRRATGEWCDNRKDAKASYKAKLKAAKAENKRYWQEA